MEMFDLDRHARHGEYDDLGRRGMSEIHSEELAFSIMHGNGNVILVVDEAISGLTGGDITSDLARELCAAFRSWSVDGIAFVRSDTTPVRMTYFERDGTHSQMCGNALRCVTRYGTENEYLRSESDTVATDDGPKWVSAAGGVIRVAVGPGREFQKVAADRYFVFSGLPHLVLLLGDNDDLDAIDVKTAGAALRFDDRLCRQLNHPEGLHVDFVQRQPDSIRIRTYEVGVEDETLACGTGAAACACVANRVWDMPYPVRVVVRGGEMRVDNAAHGLLISGVTGYLGHGRAVRPGRLFSTDPVSVGA
jgi:diaminopimelate epimerase